VLVLFAATATADEALDTAWIVDTTGEGGTGACRITADATNEASRAAKREIAASGTVSQESLAAIMRNAARLKLIRVGEGFELLLVLVAGIELDRPVALDIDGEPVLAFPGGACADIKRGVSGCPAGVSDAARFLVRAEGARAAQASYTPRGEDGLNEVLFGLAGLASAVAECRIMPGD
jgi:hypothetical protein